MRNDHGDKCLDGTVQGTVRASDGKTWPGLLGGWEEASKGLREPFSH